MSNTADAWPSLSSLRSVLAAVAGPYPPMMTVDASGTWVADTTNGQRYHNGKKLVVEANINHHGDRVFLSKSGKCRNNEEQPQT